MASDVRVVEDGLEQRPPARRPASAWVWLVIGIAVGLGFGVVFFTPTASIEDEQPAAATAPSIAPIEDPANTQGIADVIPGFPDALVAVSAYDGQGLKHILWPKARDKVTRSLPGGNSGAVRFDVSGTWIATATNVPDSEGFVLSMGRPTGLVPLVSNVTSFSWNDEEAAFLSYTQLVDGQWLLWVVGPNRKPDLITRGMNNRGEVAAWGDWGWAIQTQSGEVTLLTSSAEINDVYEGIVLDSHPTAGVVIADDELMLVSTSGVVRTLETSLNSIGGADAAELSPDGTKLAVVGGSGLKVLPVDQEGEVLAAPITSSAYQPAQVAWSSDSRFVIVPWSGGIIVVDTVENGRVYEDLTSQRVRAVAVIRLSGS
ncbi:MAG: hypothetical protein ACC658_15040 [Acidimicrobiia bacterium]